MQQLAGQAKPAEPVKPPVPVPAKATGDQPAPAPEGASAQPKSEPSGGTP
jgi:hypothetical protein